MKFYILVKNEKYGDIKSETFDNVSKEDYEKIIPELLNKNVLDFYDEKGNFVVVPETTFKESLIYLMKVK
jgi:hypothetical protein